MCLRSHRPRPVPPPETRKQLAIGLKKDPKIVLKKDPKIDKLNKGERLSLPSPVSQNARKKPTVLLEKNPIIDQLKSGRWVYGHML